MALILIHGQWESAVEVAIAGTYVEIGGEVVRYIGRHDLAKLDNLLKAVEAAVPH